MLCQGPYSGKIKRFFACTRSDDKATPCGNEPLQAHCSVPGSPNNLRRTHRQWQVGLDLGEHNQMQPPTQESHPVEGSVLSLGPYSGKIKRFFVCTRSDDKATPCDNEPLQAHRSVPGSPNNKRSLRLD